MNLHFRKAIATDILPVWQIIQQAILRRKADGSNQWQDGYPNLKILETDIKNSEGYVLILDGVIAGYCAILINDEPAYEKIEGNWLTSGDFVVFHRVAVAESYLGKGLAAKILDFIEAFARVHQICSIKADTNFDNVPMLKTFEKMHYNYCGQVYFRGSPRKAFEKVLPEL